MFHHPLRGGRPGCCEDNMIIWWKSVIIFSECCKERGKEEFRKKIRNRFECCKMFHYDLWGGTFCWGKKTIVMKSVIIRLGKLIHFFLMEITSLRVVHNLCLFTCNLPSTSVITQLFFRQKKLYIIISFYVCFESYNLLFFLQFLQI